MEDKATATSSSAEVPAGPGGSNVPTLPTVLELNCAVVCNAWGKKGRKSLVARLKDATEMTFRLENSRPYAQLWLGDHPSYRTTVKLPNDIWEMRLRDWLKVHPEQLSTSGKVEYPGPGLPFLMKILSIESPLALQLHPDKKLAEELHKKEPEVFDNNRKPEMAIALTPFKALVGIRPGSQIYKFFKEIPEMKEAYGESLREDTFQGIGVVASGVPGIVSERMFLDVMFDLTWGAKPSMKTSLERLVNRVKKDPKLQCIQEFKTLLEIDEHFPGDCGAWAVFILNIVELQPGEAIFIDAMVPHAYLSGDCIECQASSDNVLRAAFTHKRRDCHIIKAKSMFTPHPVDTLKVKVRVEHTERLTTFLYPSPYIDFAVTKYLVTAGPSCVRIPALPMASVCIVLQGTGEASWTNAPSISGRIRKPNGSGNANPQPQTDGQNNENKTKMQHLADNFIKVHKSGRFLQSILVNHGANGIPNGHDQPQVNHGANDIHNGHGQPQVNHGANDIHNGHGQPQVNHGANGIPNGNGQPQVNHGANGIPNGHSQPQANHGANGIPDGHGQLQVNHGANGIHNGQNGGINVNNPIVNHPDDDVDDDEEEEDEGEESEEEESEEEEEEEEEELSSEFLDEDSDWYETSSLFPRDVSPVRFKTSRLRFKPGTSLYVAAGACLELSLDWEEGEEEGEGHGENVIIYRGHAGFY